MKCDKCNSTNIILFNHRNINDSVITLDNDQLSFQNLKVNYIFEHSRYPYQKLCYDCFHIDSLKEEIKQVYSPQIDNKEITLDLDDTLIYYNEYHQNSWNEFDFIIKLENGFDLKIKKRPYLNKFIKYCCKKFKKINIYTAAEDWYAAEVMKNINIPKEKLGFIKTREDCVWKRSIKFQKEWIKKINKNFIVDDKSHVYEGVNNKIYKIEPYLYNGEKDDDKELLKLIDFIEKKKQIQIINKNTINLYIELFLKNLKIKVNQIKKEDVYKLMKNIKQINEEEMRNSRVMTNLSSFPYYIQENNKNRLVFADLNYKNYLILMNSLQEYNQDDILSQDEYLNWKNNDRK